MKYKSISKKFTIKFYHFVESAKNILITSHISPDDDAIGSTLALRLLLVKLYPEKKIDIAVSGYPSDRFSCFDGYQYIKFNSDITEYLKNYQLLICLDGGQYSRFSVKPDLLKSVNYPKICIDHHSSETDNFSLTVSQPIATSTSELIFKLIPKSFKLDNQFCEAILLGLLGDTGSFSFIKEGQYHIFDIVKKILSVTHLNIQEFKSRYMTIDPESFEIIRELMKNSQFLHVEGWPDFQISYTTKEFIVDNKYSDNQISEGSSIFVAQYVRLIKKNNWGFVITPHIDGSCHFSFRSLPGSVNVRDLTERMGIGGGHDRASGAKMQVTDPKDALKKITDWMSQNLPVLV